MFNRHKVHETYLVIGTLLLSLLLGACNKKEEARPNPAPQPTPAPAPVQATTAPAAALAVQPSDVDGVEVAVLEVKRTGADTVTVRWQYRNKTPEPKEVLRVPEIGLLAEREHWSYALGSVAYLIDPINKKKYLVVTDAEGTPLAARHDAAMGEGGNHLSFTIPASQTLTTWAKFPAPPESVAKVTVSVPAAPPFEDMPISK